MLDNHTKGKDEGSSLLDPKKSGKSTLHRINTTATPVDPRVNNEITAQLEEMPWYQTYATTTILVAVVHLLFLYHWITRKSRRKLLVSYKSIIQKKKYHKALPAILSHAPSKTTRQQPNNSANSQRNILGIPVGQYIMLVRDWYRSSAFSNGRHLSGLPLLFYNAHILWSCRALEGDIDSYSYARLLWGLTLVAFVLDLWFTFSVLSMVRDMNHATSSPFLMGASLSSSSASPRPAGVQQFERLLSHRSIGSLTIVTSGLLVVFRDRFPYVPLQVLPFLERTQLSVFYVPSLTYGLCVVILLALSYPVHPIASLACGTLSGMLWTSELTSFLVQPYWSNGSIACYLILCILSLKASGSSWIPCVEHVSWDARGRIIHRDDPHHGPLLVVESIEQQQQQQDGRVGDDSSDSSSHSLEEDRAHELPLFGSSTTTTTTSRGAEDDNSSLRHRLPMMEDPDDDEDDDDEDDNDEYRPLVSNATARSTTMRSRRTPSLSRV